MQQLVSSQRSAPAAVQRDAAPASSEPGTFDFAERAAWAAAAQYAPQLVSMLRAGPSGVTDWLEQQAISAATAGFNTLTSPIRVISGTGSQLNAQFTPLIETIQDTGKKIAANDCSPLQSAATKIQHTAEQIVQPVIEELQPVVAKIQGFLNLVWDKLGAPIWSWIKSYAAQQWETVKQLATWIWDLGAPMRKLGAAAWDWLKNKLGLGDTPEGQDGALQWIQNKLEVLWQRILAKLEPYRKQIEVVRNVAADIGSATVDGAKSVVNFIRKAGSGLSWLGGRLGQGSALLAGRNFLQKTLIPSLTDSLRQFTSSAGSMANAAVSALGRFANGLDTASNAIADSVFSFAAAPVNWLATEIHAISEWASSKLVNVVSGIQTTIDRFEHFLNNLADFLKDLDGVASNVWKLPAFLAGKAWNLIPACIRNPVIDFVVPIILRQIELFEALARDNEAWQKTKGQIMAVVKKVFVDKDMMGAVKAGFVIVLRAFNLAPEMLDAIAAKALSAWDVISKKPLDFIKNAVRSLGAGFKLLWGNITEHVGHGIQEWLFGELDEQGVKPPASWTDPKALFGFVTDVLGLSVAHIADLVSQRLNNPALSTKIQTWVGRFQRAWDWITHVLDTSKSPAENTKGLIDQAKDFGTSILAGAAEWVTGKVLTELAELGAAAAASGGLSEVLDVARRIYRAMLTAKRWAGKILQIANNTLDHVVDIASGNIPKVGKVFQQIMDSAMPVVIGFLADQVGLGGVGKAIRDIVTNLRKDVDKAIIWLIDKTKSGIEALIGAGSKAVGAVRKWWQSRVTFASGQHSIYIESSGVRAQPMVASNPTPLKDFLRVSRVMLEAIKNEEIGGGTEFSDKNIKVWKKALEAADPLGSLIIEKVNDVLTAENRDNGKDDPIHDANKVNEAMKKISVHLAALIDLVYPEAKTSQAIPFPDDMAELASDKTRLIKWKAGGRLGRVLSVESLSADDRRNPFGRAEIVIRIRLLSDYKNTSYTDLVNSQKNVRTDFDLTWNESRRVRFLGETPDKDSAVRKKVEERYLKQNRMNYHDGVYLVRDWRLGVYFPLEKMHMGHVIDAVHWWNTVGRFTGMRSSEVRSFMEDDKNYELEYGDDNSRRGMELARGGVEYLPPVK